MTEDGSVWVTLDDNEAHYFRVLGDEVFGRQNFILDISWQKLDGIMATDPEKAGKSVAAQLRDAIR